MKTNSWARLNVLLVLVLIGNLFLTFPIQAQNSRSADEITIASQPLFLSSDDYPTDRPQLAPNFSLNKTVANTAVAAGATVTYTLWITNTGTDPSIESILTDPFPANWMVTETVLTPADRGTVAVTNNIVQWTTDITHPLNAGDGVALSIVVRAPLTLTCPTGLTNTATLMDPALAQPISAVAPTVTAYPNIQWTEGFESVISPTLPLNWSTASYGGTRVWATSNARAHSGTNSAVHQSSNGETDWLVSAPILLGPVPELHFWEYNVNPNLYYRQSLWVCVGASCGLPITSIYTKVAEFGNPVAAWREQVVDLSLYAGQSVRLAFRYETGNTGGPDWYLDDLQINDGCAHTFVAPLQSYVCPGRTNAVTTTVVNTAYTTETVAVTLTPGLWSAQLAPALVPDLGPGERQVITLSVLVPGMTPMGTQDVLTLTATGQVSGLTSMAVVSLTASPATQWNDLPAVPRAARAHGVVYAGGSLYQIGGNDSSSSILTTYRYDLVSRQWFTMANLLNAARFIDPVEINGKIYVAGGYTNTTNVINMLQIYDIAGNSWTTGTVLPQAWGRYAGVQFNGEYYVIGGGTSGSTTVYIYNPISDTWRTGTGMLQPRQSPAAAAINGKIYVAGGYQNGSVLRSAEVYDPISDTWTLIASMPYSVAQAADGVLENRYLIVAGGSRYADTTFPPYQFKSVLAYDTLNDTWVQLPDMIWERNLAEGASNGQDFYVLGGQSGNFYVPPLTRLNACTAAGCQVDFIYHDLEDVIHSGESLYLAGTFTDWGTNPLLLEGDPGATVFTTTASLPTCAGTTPIEYKYIVSGTTIGMQWDWVNTSNRSVLPVMITGTLHDYRDVEVGWANLDTSLYPREQSIILGESANAAGQVYIANVTPPAGAGRGVIAEAGYGTGVNPAAWDWSPIPYRDQVDNNDRFAGPFTPTLSGVYSYAVRFDGNWGAENPNRGWTYGDIDGSPFNPAMAGILTVTFPTTPNLVITAPPLTFNLGPDATDELTLTIANTGTAPLTWTLTEIPPAAWLSALPTGGTLAADEAVTVTLTADSTGLALGTYTTTLRIGSNDPDQNAVDIPVTLNVQAPDITVTPQQITQVMNPGNTDVRTLTLANVGNLDLEWLLGESPPAPWLSITPTDGTIIPGGQAVISLTFDTTGLAVGVYTATLTVTSDDPDEGMVNVPITLTVNATPIPNITVSPASFNVSLGYNITGTRAMTVGNTGTATLTWSLAETPAVAWLNVSPTGSTLLPGGQTAVTLSFDTTGLTAGTYTTTLRITSNDPDENPLDVPVTLNVTYPALQPPAPVSVVGVPDQPIADVPLPLHNSGNAPLNWTLVESPTVTWLSAAPTNGVVNAGQTETVTLSFDTTGLAVGTHTTTLHITTNDPLTPTVDVPVTLTLGAPTPDLSASTKTIDTDTVFPGHLITFTINLSNTGTAAANVTYTDTLPIGLTWIAGPLTGTLPVSAGQAVPIYIVVQAGVNITPGTQLTNTVWISDGSQEFVRQAAVTLAAPVLSIQTYLPVIMKGMSSR